MTHSEAAQEILAILKKWIRSTLGCPSHALVVMTQDEFDALDPKDPNTLYLIKRPNAPDPD